IVNCETANLNKIVSNGIKQKEDIEFIKNNIGLDALPKQLKDIAKLRLKHPDTSLKELGEMLNPSISKSGVNHRLKKINKIAESLRGN
ncbi:MAG: DNA-binding protein WhiA, partial [Eubacteriales bacterium]|nr:DNA-binding protein WhiA [Eubacteriales bacterium]